MRAHGILLALAVAGSCVAQEYDVVFIYGPGEPEFMPQALRGDGTAVGARRAFGDTYVASTWKDGVFRMYKDFGAGSIAMATNERGQIAGTADRAGGGSGPPAIWEPDGTFRPLTDIPDVGHVNAITNQGVAFGQVSLRFEQGSRSFVWQNGSYQYLPLLGIGPYSHPKDMNDNMVAIGGEQSREGGAFAGWMWTPSGGLVEIPVWGADINEHDVIVGLTRVRVGMTRAVYVPALYRNGRVEVLPARGVPTALNNSEAIIGRGSRGGGSGIDKAIIWRTPASDPVALEDLIDPRLGLWITTPFAINNAGQILAYARPSDSRDAYVVRLDPVPRPWLRRP